MEKDQELNKSSEVQNNVYWKDVMGKPVEYTPEYHTHDDYAKRYHKHTVADIIDLDGANFSGDVPEHIHDDRYYTKAQVDEKIKDSSNVDMSSYAKKEYVDTELEKKSNLDHKHDITDFEGLESFADFYRKYELHASNLTLDSDGFYVGHLTHGLRTNSLDIIIKDRFENELIASASIVDIDNISVLTDLQEDLLIYIKKLNVTN